MTDLVQRDDEPTYLEPARGSGTSMLPPTVRLQVNRSSVLRPNTGKMLSYCRLTALQGALILAKVEDWN